MIAKFGTVQTEPIRAPLGPFGTRKCPHGHPCPRPKHGRTRSLRPASSRRLNPARRQQANRGTPQRSNGARLLVPAHGQGREPGQGQRRDRLPRPVPVPVTGLLLILVRNRAGGHGPARGQTRGQTPAHFHPGQRSRHQTATFLSRLRVRAWIPGLFLIPVKCRLSSINRTLTNHRREEPRKKSSRSERIWRSSAY